MVARWVLDSGCSTVARQVLVGISGVHVFKGYEDALRHIMCWVLQALKKETKALCGKEKAVLRTGPL